MLKETKYRNKYVVYEDYAEIILENKDKKEVGRAKVDLEDLHFLIKYRWTFHRGYAFNFRDRMHRVVLGLDRPDAHDHNTCVDHINGNTLDNRKANLRICTKVENAQNAIKPRANNTSGCIGVSQYKPGKFRAYITVNKRVIDLKTYNSFEDAVKARLEAELFYFGEYSGCNRKFLYLLKD